MQARKRFVWAKRTAALAAAIFAALGLVAQPASCQYIPSDVAERFAGAAKEIIVEVVDFLTPIVDAICAGMIIIGIILAAGLRQEFYGIRLITSGGIGLIVMHIVVPVLLSFL